MTGCCLASWKPIFSKAISASLDVHQHWPLTLALCGIALAEESTFSPSVVSYNAMLSALERGILDPSVLERWGCLTLRFFWSE